jgi:hypothetical protein
MNEPLAVNVSKNGNLINDLQSIRALTSMYSSAPEVPPMFKLIGKDFPVYTPAEPIISVCQEKLTYRNHSQSDE